MTNKKNGRIFQTIQTEMFKKTWAPIWRPKGFIKFKRQNLRKKMIKSNLEKFKKFCKKNFTPKLQYGGLVRAIEDAGLSEKTLSANELRDVIINIRRTKLPDPAEQGNAGSFFKNPIVPASKAEALQKEFPTMPSYPAQEGKVKLAAGWLIEQAGWKGKSLGAAAVHDRQALVLVNKGGATGQDIYRLCQAVRNAVSERFGIMLETEVNLL